jgi:hypothetical protein
MSIAAAVLLANALQADTARERDVVVDVTARWVHERRQYQASC